MPALLMSLLLAAAAGGGAYLYQAAAGGALVLRRAVEIPAHTATVYFQGGRVLPAEDVDEFFPHCLLVSRRVGEAPQRVPPGAFTIRRAYPYEEEEGVARLDAPVRVAAWDTVGLDLADARTTDYFTTRLELAGGPFPDALYFECRQLSDYALGDHIRLEEFRQAVGGIWSLG